MKNNNGKKKVVWGTGLIASKYVGYAGIRDISFFIDNNRSKSGTIFFGKPVYHPEEVEDWDHLYVYVPYNYYDEISAQLKEKRLAEGRDYTAYHMPKEGGKKCLSDEVLNKFYLEISETCESLKGKMIFFGFMAAHDKGICGFLNCWNTMLGGHACAVFSEACWIPSSQTKEKFKFPAYVLPDFFDTKVYPADDEKEECYKEEVDCLFGEHQLRELANSYRKQCDGLKEDYEYYYTFHLFEWYKKIFYKIKPSRVVMWGSYGFSHRLVKCVCERLGIPVGYIHPGIYAGTFSLDIKGEMGESYPAVYSEAFQNLPVTEEEIRVAEKMLEYLHKTGINRKIQPQNDAIQRIQKQLKPDRPVIFYAGQNDFESGMGLEDEERIEYHSPAFKTSTEAALYLNKICLKNDWNLIYKPHPMMDFYIQKEEKLPEGMIYIDKADINQLIDISDVTVTVLSQTGYVALTREKPVVMLGYTQLRGKECCYEAFDRDSIEKQLSLALEQGFTRRQKKEFVKHTAQLLKYYLFDDLQEKPFSYGRRLPVTWEEIERFAEKLEKNMQ